MKKISVLETYDIRTKQRTVLHEFEGVYEAPNWLADGDTLVVNTEGKLYRYSISRDTAEVIAFEGCGACNNDHVPSADGKTIAFSSGELNEEHFTSQIYRVSTAGGKPELLVAETPSFLHGWSRDGQRVVYCGFRSDDVDVYIKTMGCPEVKLTGGKGFNDGPEFTPDDREILFNSTRSGLMQIFRMNADGTDIRALTDSERNNWFAHMSPDGRNIVYMSFRKGDVEPWEHVPDKEVSLWLIREDGQEEKLLDLFGGQGTINVNSWAPDSKRFAFMSYRYEA